MRNASYTVLLPGRNTVYFMKHYWQSWTRLALESLYHIISKCTLTQSKLFYNSNRHKWVNLSNTSQTIEILYTIQPNKTLLCYGITCYFDFETSDVVDKRNKKVRVGIVLNNARQRQTGHAVCFSIEILLGSVYNSMLSHCSHTSTSLIVWLPVLLFWDYYNISDIQTNNKHSLRLQSCCLFAILNLIHFNNSLTVFLIYQIYYSVTYRILYLPGETYPVTHCIFLLLFTRYIIL